MKNYYLLRFWWFQPAYLRRQQSEYAVGELH
jgi:hypothetical protein